MPAGGNGPGASDDFGAEVAAVAGAADVPGALVTGAEDVVVGTAEVGVQGASDVDLAGGVDPVGEEAGAKDVRAALVAGTAVVDGTADVSGATEAVEVADGGAGTAGVVAVGDAVGEVDVIGAARDVAAMVNVAGADDLAGAVDVIGAVAGVAGAADVVDTAGEYAAGVVAGREGVAGAGVASIVVGASVVCVGGAGDGCGLLIGAGVVGWSLEGYV